MYGLGQYIFDDGVITPNWWNSWYGHDSELLGFTSFAYRHDGYNASIAGGVSSCGGLGVNFLAMESYMSKIQGWMDATANGMVLVVSSEEEYNASSSTANMTTDSEMETLSAVETLSGVIMMPCTVILTMAASMLLL